MRDFDFDKIIKHQVQQLPQEKFSYDEKKWSGLEARLNDAGVLSPQRDWRQFLPYLIATLLLLTNAFWMWRSFQYQGHISTMQKDMNALQESIQVSNELIQHQVKILETSSRDTIIYTPAPSSLFKSGQTKEHIIERVFYVPHYVPSFGNGRENLLENGLENSTFSHPNQLQTFKPQLTPQLEYSKNFQLVANTGNWRNTLDFDRDNFDDKIEEQIQGIQNDINTSNTVESKPTENVKATVKEEHENLIKKLESVPTSKIEYELTELDYSLDSLLDTTIHQREITLKDRLTYISNEISSTAQVSSYGLGTAASTNFGYQNTDYSFTNEKYGLSAELNFSNRIKVGTDIFWTQTSGELEDIENGNYPDDYFLNYPNLVGNNPDDVFTKVERRDQSVEAALYAKYMFLPNKKLSPFIGGGLQGAYNYETRLEYYFLLAPNFDDDYEVGYEFVNDNQFRINTYSILLGTEFDIIPRLTIRLDSRYNSNFKIPHFDNNQMSWFSGNVGLLYNFGLSNVQRISPSPDSYRD